MAIVRSKEYPGLGFDYDSAKNPFFMALVQESLRKLSSLPTGKMLFKALHDARPSFRSAAFPADVNVALRPPPDKQMTAPGLSVNRAANTISIKDNKAFLDWDNRIAGGLIAGSLAKTLAEPSEATQRAATEVSAAGKPGTGCTCYVNFSNIEIRSKSGEWLPDYITLGHELIHCWHMLNGSAKNDIKAEEWLTVGIKGYEGMAITENKLRKEAGIPLRKKYFPDD